MIEIKIGDSRNLIHDIEDNSIDCVMTSPPYWGLRDYSHDDQMGLETTPDEYIDNMIGLFSEVKIKLKSEGNCFVNLGDTYNKNKSLAMIPERFAIGMIQNGWILRNKVIWHKSNPMPESVTDRLSKTYEVVYHFVKSQTYFYDLDAIREQLKESSLKRMSQDVESQKGSFRGEGGNYKTNGSMKSVCHPKGKNPGDVWTIGTQPYSGAHFAVYPLELIRRPILAGCPIGGVVLDPFGGSGTTAEFCRKNQRDCIIFELNPEYESLIKERSMSIVPGLEQFNKEK